MANFRYGKAAEAFGNGEIDWIDDTIKVQLLDGGVYTPDEDGDEFLSDIPSGARIGSPAEVIGKTNELGVLGADNTEIPGVTGTTCEYLLVYKSTGVEGTSYLLFLFDTATGLPTAALVAEDGVVRWPGGVVANL